MEDVGQPVPSRSAEHARLADPSPDTPGNRKAIGLYLSERAGGAVREVYSANGQAWQYFPYEHTRSRGRGGRPQSSADFITTTSGFRFSVHTGGRGNKGKAAETADFSGGSA